MEAWSGAPVTRALHSSGHTDVTFDLENNKIITSCSEDAEIYTLSDLSSDEPNCHEPEANVTFVRFCDNRLFVGLDNFQVQIFSYPDLAKDGILTRFTAPPSCIDISLDNSFAVVGAKDNSIKIVHIENQATKLLSGHTAPILSVAYDPVEDFIVSSSCDGSYKFWKIGDTTCVKTMELVTKSNDFDTSPTLARMSWQPSKALFVAVPNKNQVHFLKRGTFDCSFVYHFDQLSEDVSQVSWKPSGEYVAVCDIKGAVFLCEVADKTCTTLRYIAGKKNRITGFYWLPIGVGFIAADTLGMVYEYKNVYKPKSVASQALDQSSVMDKTCKGADDIFDEMIENAEAAAVANDDDEEDGSISLDKIKNTYTIHSDDEDSAGRVAANATDAPTEGATSVMLDDVMNLPPAPPPVTIVPYQHTFMTSSSPVGLSSRYMKWNLVGIVRRHSAPPPENDEEEDAAVHGDSIDVEFHDSSFYHPIHITDTHEFTMADISEQALLLATPKSPFNSTSLLQCHTFSFWDHSKLWTVDMPGKHEHITCICLGENWCAASTDHGVLRLFSISGLQLTVVMLSGSPISFSGHGDSLLYVYQESQTVENDRFFGAEVFTVTGYDVKSRAKTQFPRCKAKDSVIWLGFSLEGAPLVGFNSGMIWMMTSPDQGSGHSWLPVFNFTNHLASDADRVWVVGVTGKSLRAIYCKASKFPALLPRPIVTTYSLQLPLCHSDSEQTSLEQQLHEHRLFGTISNTELKSAFLKLFALACRTDRDCRAVDIATIMPNEETVVLAIKYATKTRKLQLAQKLSAIAHDKENIEKQDQVSSIDDDPPLFSQSQSNQEAPEPMDNPILMRAFSSSNNPDVSSSSSRSGFGGLSESFDVKKNPFRSSGSVTSDDSKKGSAVFDDMQIMKPERLKLGDKKSGTKLKLSQTTASKAKAEAKAEKNAVPAKKLTPFQAFFEDNRASFVEDNADASTEELLSIGIKRWKGLSPENKALYADGNKPSVPFSSTENSKRKAEENAENGLKEKKTRLEKVKSVGNKLDQFSFS